VIVESLLPLIRRVAEETGTGIVLVEQHVHMALETADRVTFLAHGDVVYTGAARDLAAHPERVEAAYLGAQGEVGR
jgi:branched-chain amino acid transport system ATP-binding protein